MPKVIVVSRNGSENEIDAPLELSLMEAIRESGLEELAAICGGCCSCGTCHVYSDPAFTNRLPAMKEDENDILDGSPHRKSNSRLACQIRIENNLAGLRVTIAPEE